MSDKPWKPSRRERRVLLALLASNGQVSTWQLWRLSQTGAGRVYLVLARLERLGWVLGKQEVLSPLDDSRPPRRFYRLTPDGRNAVAGLLKLEIPHAQH